MTIPRPARECSVSIRLVWPYARVISADPELIESMTLLGVGSSEFANPETRVPHRAVMALLKRYVERTGDRSLGLRAGSSIEHGDFDVLESAARSCSTLRDAIRCIGRYVCLLNEACRFTLREEGDQATWEFRLIDGVATAPTGNDFAVACAVTFARRYTDLPQGPIEVHFTHTEATDPAGYARVFGPNVKLGMPSNACLFDRALLDRPMRRADPLLQMAFETRAKEILEQQRAHQGVVGQVRDVVMGQLGGGAPSMASTARAMAMSSATLRRRLADEDTSFTDILDVVRRELAGIYLCDPHISTREVAFLLGYSHAKAFYGAFRRWTGGTPADFRAKALSPDAPPA